MTLTKERLAELRALADAAMPGPWFSFSEFPPPTCLVHVDGSDELKRPTDYRKILASVRHDNGFGFKDAAFIAAAREVVPSLLDEVNRLQRTVDRKDEQMGELQGEVERLRSTAREWEVKCDNRVAAMELAQAEVERLKRETQKAYERMETVIRETTRIVDEANAPAARLALLERTVEDLAKASMVIVRKLGVDGFTTVGSIWDEDMHEAVNAVRRAVSAVTPGKP